MALKHQNSGRCPRCQEILDRYPDFNGDLRAWFEMFQLQNPEAHTSEAGRGRDAQEALYQRRASRAQWGESAHNYNAALDLFEQGGKSHKDIYERDWFDRKLQPALPPWIKWYGEPGSKFYELPHVELKDWRAMAERGELQLVEPA